MAGAEEINDYAVLAGNYDLAYGGLRGRIDEMAVMRALVDNFHPNPQSLLDLATGTGIVPRIFQHKIGTIVGLDSSPEMLAVAQSNVRGADFIEGDMTDFDLGMKFDVITCLFNSMNHLRNFDKWRDMFRTTERHLNPEGIFIFDIITAGLVRKLSAREDPNTWSIKGGNYMLEVEQSGENDNDYVTTFTLQLDGNNGVPTTTGKLHQTVFPIKDIESATSECFESVFALDLVGTFAEDGRRRPVTEDSSRPFFVYQHKPV